MRDRKAAFLTIVMSVMGLTLWATGASAMCRACDAFLHCVDQVPGAKLCVESPGVCSMVLPCFAGGGSRIPDEGDGLLTLSLFGAEGAVTTTLETDAGPLAVGDGARGTSARTRGRLAAAMLAHGRDYAVWFADSENGGFAVKRGEAGGAVHVEVLEMAGGVPGRVLATALLLPHDRLRVGVRVNGREQLLVVQASVMARGRAVSERSRLRHALREAGREIPETTRPLLEPRPL